jgi:hypothetical protein
MSSEEELKLLGPLQAKVKIPVPPPAVRLMDPVPPLQAICVAAAEAVTADGAGLMLAEAEAVQPLPSVTV